MHENSTLQRQRKYPKLIQMFFILHPYFSFALRPGRPSTTRWSPPQIPLLPSRFMLHLLEYLCAAIKEYSFLLYYAHGLRWWTRDVSGRRGNATRAAQVWGPGPTRSETEKWNSSTSSNKRKFSENEWKMVKYVSGRTTGKKAQETVLEQNKTETRVAELIRKISTLIH